MRQWLRRDLLRGMSLATALPASGAFGATTGIPDAASGSSRTEAERQAGVVPVDTRFAPGDVRRYGADPTGERDSSAAFFAANAVGAQGGGVVRIPSGRYLYGPEDTLELQVSWIGDGAHETMILCDTGRFRGEFFRMIGSTELRDVLLKAVRGSREGTCLRLAAANAGQFTGHGRLTRVWIIGFDYNIRCDNNFEMTFDQVRSGEGNEGFYCDPVAITGNGYATSHLHLNCYYAGNKRNVLYSPSIRYAFRTITFVGGAIEGATGDSCQASFTRCAPLKFIQIYLEAAPRIPALVLNDCDASIDGAYLGGSGGIRAGENTRITLRHVLALSPTDVFKGSDGTQFILMEDCRWPAAGNVLNAARITLRDTSINGASYPETAWEGASLGATRISRQTTLVDSPSPQDVYRFQDLMGATISSSVAGRFEIIARDKGDPTNQTLYECWIGAAGGGQKHASLVLLQRMVQGTDVGAAEMPLTLAVDDVHGVKLQFCKRDGIERVVVNVLFMGLVPSFAS